MSAIATAALWSVPALGTEEFAKNLAKLEREFRYPGRCVEAVIPISTRDDGSQSRLSIVLPKDYAEQPEKRYAVMYGVLDGAGSNAGRYNIVEAADRLQDEGFFAGLIVIHINSGNLQAVRDRWWPDHVVKDVIPYIDATYRTIPDAAHRATAGSSGRTIPAQTLVRMYPEVVGNILVVAGSTHGIDEAAPAVKKTRWFMLIGARDLEPFTITGLDEFAKAGWTFGDNYCVQFATGPTFGNLSHGQAKIAYGIRSALRFFFRKEPGPMPVTSAQIVPFLDFPTCVFRPDGRSQFQPVRDRFDISRDSMADWQVAVQLMSGDDFVMHYPDWSVFSSDDKSLVTVGEEGAAFSLSQNGRLRARGVGTTLVRASIPYGGQKIEASAQVNVGQLPPAGAPKGMPYVAGGRANEHTASGPRRLRG